MEKVKKSGDKTILKKRSGRFGVKDGRGHWVRGEEKAKILAAEGLITLAAPTSHAEERRPDEQAPETPKQDQAE